MANAARAEEGFFAREAAVDELVDHHKVTRRHVFAERAAGGNGKYIGDAKPLERVDIGAVVDGGGAMHMPAAVAWQKGHAHTVQRAGQNGVRRCAPGAGNVLPCCIFQPVNLVKPAAADNADHRVHNAPRFISGRGG